MTGSNLLDLSDKTRCIGDVFTPLRWGEFAIQTFGLYEKWMNGATVFDPTMGEGNLLEALVRFGLAQGKTIAELPTARLFGNELNTVYYTHALEKFNTEFGVDMTANFTNEDFLALPHTRYDLIFGNPPWQNFVDLPESYKEKIKSHFFKYDLIQRSQHVLLGGSRIDFAALIIQIAIKEFLVENGEAILFMPLSLLLNDGANQYFRTYSIDDVKFAPEKVFDFNNEPVFVGVSTRYGLAQFRRDREAVFPIPYYRLKKGRWPEYLAKPLFHATDPLSIIEISDSASLDNMEPISLHKESSPRQGVNTCGANEIFFFDSYQQVDSKTVAVSNKLQHEILLPRQFVYPLATSPDFKRKSTRPVKWVLLPYNKKGKVLGLKQIKAHPLLYNYLQLHRTALESRKGVMINGMLSRGHWWALLGVGEYTFFPYKIIWEAYGKTEFRPKIFEGQWQANQSLQAFIPMRSMSEANRVLLALKDKRIEKYLLSLKMEGTMNWAQPGKIKKLIRFAD